MHLIARFSQLLRCEVALLNKYLRYQLLLEATSTTASYVTYVSQMCLYGCLCT